MNKKEVKFSELKRLKEEGMTVKEISSYYGLSLKQTKEMLKSVGLNQRAKPKKYTVIMDEE